MNLIYTTAFGHEIYSDMAQEMVFSARKHGFTGEILVLTDREHKFSGAAAKVVEKGGMSKAAITQVEGLSPEYVAFVDSDCIFLQNPDLLFGHDKPYIATERGEYADSYNVVFMSEEEKTRSENTPKVNSGTFVLPWGLAHEFLTGWEALWLLLPREEIARTSPHRFNAELMDQPALQKYLLGMDWEPMEAGKVSFPFYGRPGKHTVLSHYCAPLNDGKNDSMQNKQVVIGMMKQANGRYQGKNLLYTTCFGKEIYFRLAEEMIKSARKAGYDGEIYVLADKEWVFPGAAKTILLENWDGKGLMRTVIYQFLDLSQYGHVVYSDTDIIWAKNPNKLMCWDKPAIATASTWLHASPVTCGFLTPEERTKARAENRYGINSGTIVVPGKQAEQFFQDWESTWSEFDKAGLPDLWAGTVKNLQLWDEAALQALCFRGMDFAPIPQGEIHFPVLGAYPGITESHGYHHKTFDSSVVAVHFVGLPQHDQNKTRLYGWMRKCENPMNIPVVCEESKKDSSDLFEPQSPIQAIMNGQRRIEQKLDMQAHAIAAITAGVLKLLKEQKNELV